jgi:hypothetical protein
MSATVRRRLQGLDKCEVPGCREIANMDLGPRNAHMRCREHADVGPLPTDLPPVRLAGERDPDIEGMASALYAEFGILQVAWTETSVATKNLWRRHARRVLGMLARSTPSGRQE